MRSIISNYLNLFLGMATTLILTPFLLTHLGTERFGLWSLTFSVLGIFGLLDLGFTNTLVRYVCECRGAQDERRRDRVVNSLGALFLLLSLVSLLGIGLMSLRYQEWLKPSQELGEVAYPLLWILGLRVAILALPLSLFRSLLTAYQEFVYLNAVQASCTVLSALASGWTLWSGRGGLLELAWINLGFFLLEHLLYAIRCFQVCAPLRLHPKLASWTLLREVGGYSSASFLTAIASFVLLRIDPFIVQSVLGLKAVALYAVPLKISEYLLFLFKRFMDVITTRTATMMGEGKQEQISQLFMTTSRWSMVPATAVTIPGVLMSGPLLAAWVGPEMLDSAPVLQVLVLSTWLSVPQIVASGILSMSGHHAVTARAALWAALLNFSSSCLLAYKIGLLGVACGTLLTTLWVDLFLVVRPALRVFQVPLGKYLAQVLWPLILPGLACLAVSAWLRPFLMGAPLIGVLAGCCLGAGLFLLLYWGLSARRGERGRSLS